MRLATTASGRPALRLLPPATANVDAEQRSLRQKHLVVAVLTALAGLLLLFAPVQRLITEHWSYPLAFRLRLALGLAPPASEELQIYAVDDQTVASIEQADPALAEWQQLIEALAASKPRAILIDKMFGLPSGAGRPGFAAHLRALGVPVATAAFVTPVPIPGRATLNLDAPSLQLGAMLAPSVSSQALAWLADPVGPVYAYGPHPSLQGDFSIVGQVGYDPIGSISPLRRLDDHHALAHLALAAGLDVKVDADGLLVQGQPVPLDDHGRLVVNLVDQAQLFARQLSLRRSFLALRRGEQVPTPPRPGQIVLIAPSLFTGATDFVPTPAGVMPGSYVVASVLNSALTGRWLRQSGAPLLAIGLAWLSGTVLGCTVYGGLALALFSALDLLVVAAGLALFVKAGVIVPWLEVASAAAVAFLAQYTLTARYRERQSVRLRQALGSLLSGKRLEHLIRHPEQLTLAPTGRVVTIIFVDIVGFSLVVEQQGARQAFASLKRILNSLTDTIHAYGGVIDKTLGDGVLAYFGYNFAGESMNDHADQALRCAIELQQESMRRVMAPEDQEDSYPYPLRIGLNTGPAFIGDLGDERRIDITLIGQAVNLAQRLETACNDFCILISAAAKNLLTTADEMAAQFYPQRIQIKHSKELLPVWEVDPFPAAVAMQAVRRVHERLGRAVEALTLNLSETTLQLVFAEGTAAVLAFGASGLVLQAGQDTYFGRGTEFLARLVCQDAGLQQRLEADRLNIVVCSCVWSRAEGGRFRHEYQLKNLLAAQGLQLLALFNS